MRFETPGKTDGDPLEPRFQLKQDQVDIVTKLTNPEGKTLLNVVPSAESYKSERVKQLPQGAVIVMVRFVQPCGQMCDPSSNVGKKDFDEFSLEFESKLTDMLKRSDAKFQAAMTTTSMQILQVTNVVNVKMADTEEKMVVQMAIHVENDKFNAVDVTNTLRNLVTKNPPNIRGYVMDPSAFAAEVLQATSNDSLIDMFESNERAGLIGVYVILYTCLFVCGMFAYRRYVNRVTDETLQTRMHEVKNHRRSDSWKSTASSGSLSYSSSIGQHTLASVNDGVFLSSEPFQTSLQGSPYVDSTIPRSIYTVAHPSPLATPQGVSMKVAPHHAPRSSESAKAGQEPSPYIAPFSREPSTVVFEEFVRPPSTVVDFGVFTNLQPDSDIWDHDLREKIRHSQNTFTTETLSMASTVYKR